MSASNTPSIPTKNTHDLTIRDLRVATAPIALRLRELTTIAEQDDFAPWVVEALETAAYFASLSDDALRNARGRLGIE